MKRSIVCVILSILMMFSLLAPAFAAGDECKCGNTPIVSVVGFGHVPLVNGEGTQVFAPEADAIVNAVLPAIPALLQFLADDDMDALLDAVIPAAQQIFDPIKCDENGDSIDPTVTVDRFFEDSCDTYDYYIKESEQDELSIECAETVGGDHTFIFTHDWRRSPLDTAKDLNEFIQNVKEKTGHSKVSINGQSMGTCIVQAYLALYGTQDVKNICMFSGAFTGLEMCKDLFTGHIYLDADGIVDIIIQAIKGSPDSSVLGELLKYTGLFERVIEKMAPLMNEDQYKNRLYDEIFIPYFGMFAGVWAFVPEETFNEALNYMFFNSDFSFHPSISYIAKITAYHELVQKTLEERCTEYFNDKNICFSIVSNYNRQIAPVTPSSTMNSDGVIETCRTSYGATVADRNSILGKNYVQVNDDGHNHVSPDTVVDASTCRFPECTWFIKNMEHVKFKQGSNATLFAWLLTSEKQVTISSNPLYTQFLYYNVNADYMSVYLDQYGDVDMDGDIDLVDARLALRHMLERDILEKVNLQRADGITIDGVITRDEVQYIADTFAFDYKA
ncbi:MAG: hypothetical protein J1F24_02545 [Oscillospiraceae bacterium]|nr:hypothetical protein [Oscillospiraceae bacterium]